MNDPSHCIQEAYKKSKVGYHSSLFINLITLSKIHQFEPYSQTPTTMAPIRIGLVGLSTSSKATNWAVIAHLPYLQSSQGKLHYEIVALCNSSVESARRSIAHFNLSPTTKAYGTAEDLAADPDVELVVNVTGVESHYDVLLPAVKAGKSVYTELPLASTMAQMQELVDLAEEKGIKTIFGSQGQAHPAVHLVKKMIAEDKIGKPLSTTLIATSGLPLDKPLPVAFKMLAERKAGGNFATIWFLHSESPLSRCASK